MALLENFVMIEGPDCSGKGTAADGVRDYFASLGKTIFDVRLFSKENHRLPEFSDFASFDVLLSGEPTHAWIGAAIRGESTYENDRHFHPHEIAEHFSADRSLLYRRVILPALDAGKIVIQERGVVSSLTYQPLDTFLRKGIPRDETYSFLLSLPGNRFALEHPPGLLLIVTSDAEVLLERKRARTEKVDKSMFEKVDFLRSVTEAYLSSGLRFFFEGKGTTISYLDTTKTSGPVETKRLAQEAVRSYFNL
ncbi:hypothetical protein J4430_01600 [Candidatus Woesearchaeota archaeon]|nr:hypothetical protein [Candidatus Woesearchaeota archaeon]